MSLSEITTAYSLETLRVAPLQLLLDPSNPRLITDLSDDHEFTEAEIQSAELQASVLKRVCSGEHHVQRLIEAIRRTGFLGGMHEMIVKQIGNGGQYLVLEGNRRAAALKRLLSAETELPPEIRATIEEIEVKLFKYIPNESYHEQDVIDVLLGSIHIDGPDEWGAMQKARYINKSYVRVFNRERGEMDFAFDKALALEVGENFNMKAPTVRSLLTIHRVYEQLRAASYPVTPNHYSLLELATKTRALREFFGLDWERCLLSEVGLGRFAQLCLSGDPAPVHNPKLFGSFKFVFLNGTSTQITQALSGQSSVEDLKARIKRRKRTGQFRDDLVRIRQELGLMRVAGFKGSRAEVQEIRKIRKLVNDRLWPLARGR